ncbi:MAG: acetate--CoA ligase family protein [Thermoguttaceae bacterium]|jgi:acetyltransferase|nr:acetate--CoA ligase family protein [Thermoguttaceae bacterium]
MTQVPSEKLGHRVVDSPAPRHWLDGLFYPKSVAVLGVTPTPGTVPYDIFYNILATGYRGTVYPVAPGKRSICAVRAYRYVVDIPDEVDQVVIVFPANVVNRALQQCGEKGVKSAIVISAGFREVGPKGVERELELKETCRKYGIAMVGPNCLGLINTDPNVLLNASFARKMPDRGRIAFLSQSGALCTAVLDYAREKGIGFSKFVSFGNKAGVTEIELFDYLHQDPETDVILLYLEELRDGRALIEAARRVTHGEGAKPILAIKSGRTPQGADAASSHTGSLAGEDAVCDAVFEEAGIIRVTSIEELFNSAIMYAYQPLPKGERLAIVTNAGGPGVMATDAAVRLGLKIPRFEPDTTERLRKALPAAANMKNPVDVIGDARADRYTAALSAVLDDPNVDQALVILTPQSMTDIESIAQGVCDIHREATKPIACSFMGASDVLTGIDLLQADHIPHYLLPEWACAAMTDVQRICRWRRQPLDQLERLAVDEAVARAIINAAPPGYLPEDEALAVLKAYGLPVPNYRLCQTADEAVAFAEEVGYPVVLRVVSRQVVHKSEVKGVTLNLQKADSVLGAFDRMQRQLRELAPDAELHGMLVRQMIPEGYEVILGANRDAVFGPTLMFGLGGIYVSLFKDVTFGLAPITAAAAARMVRRVTAYRLLEGARGGPAADVQNIEQCLVRVGQLVADFERITELDVNPLIALAADKGNVVADVRIRLGE